ncbi:MAG: pilus assembly PilX N-terminal domain-containing protein [Candidatus Tectomicrobia bacterium]|nr:pilus assembly PilX N-terminal domain-containing protein [Candidatus Tectomicrobia bacterium]
MHVIRFRRLSRFRMITNQRGISLVLTLVLIAFLAVLGSTAVKMTTTDLSIGATYKSTQAAFYHAEAGLAYTLSRLSDLLDTGALSLDGRLATESHRFTPPAGLTFQIEGRDTFMRVSDTRNYVARIIGRPLPNSPIRRTLEVVMRRRSALPYGVFGGDRVDLPATGAIYSYDTSRSQNPTPDISSRSVDIASNTEVRAQASHLALNIDGAITLGARSDGTDATFTFREPEPDVGPPPTTVPVGGGHKLRLLDGDHLDPDPLNALAMVEDAARQLRADNDNTTVPAISDESLTDSATLTAGQYYLKAMELGEGTSLELDAREGDIEIFTQSLALTGAMDVTAHTQGQGTVTIYLDGPGHFGTTSSAQQPTVTMTGPPTHFRIFSSSDEPLAFHHHGDFAALVYAPRASLSLGNSSATASGLLWAKTVTFNREPYTFYVDTSIPSLFLTTRMDIVSWKELRD